MEEAVLNNLTKLHQGLAEIEQAMNHVADVAGALGMSTNAKDAARGLLQAQAAIKLEIEYLYRKHVGERTVIARGMPGGSFGR